MTAYGKKIISRRDGKVKVRDSFAKVFDSILNLKISDGAFRTFLHILRRDFEDRNGFRKGYIYASTKDLAKERGISTRAVEKHLQELSQAGVIAKRRRSYRIYIRYESFITNESSPARGDNEQIFATYPYIKEEEISHKNKKIQALINSLKGKKPMLAACLAETQLEENGNLILKARTDFIATELRRNLNLLKRLSEKLFGKDIDISQGDEFC